MALTNKQAADLAAMLVRYRPWPNYTLIVGSNSEIDKAVFKTPLESLVALWLARWGDGWVERDEVQNDEFFEWAAVRLKQKGLLEEHTLPDTMRIVLRLLEK